MFAREATDAAWAAQARSRLEAQLPRVTPAGSHVRSLECRTSLCRLELVHDNRAAYRELVERAFLDTSHHIGEGPAFSAQLDTTSDGRLITVAYLGRRGQPLPQLE